MANIRVVGWLALSAVLAVTACEKKSEHSKFRKGLSKDSKVTSEWAKVVTSPDGACSCLRVDGLAKLLEKADEELISVHTADLDFVTVGENLTKVSTTPVIQKKPGDKSAEKVTPKICTWNRYTFPSAQGDLEILKVNFFFKTAFRPLWETVPAKDLLKNELLSAVDQKGCESVTFRTAQGPQEFQVIEGGRNGIKLASRNGREIRTYAVGNNDEVVITTVSLIDKPVTCDNMTAPSTARVLRSYVVSRSKNKERYQVSKNLAQLYRHIYDTPELKSGALSGSTLQYIASRAYTVGRDFNCSMPPKP